MKILHTISSIDLSQGGPSKSVPDLAISQARTNQKVTIYTKASSNPYLQESPSQHLKLKFSSTYSFSKELSNFVTIENFDILHGHGLWQMPVHKMTKIARRQNIPYIITPRGMLEPWALNTGKWKKKLALKLYQEKDLAQAACIHATAKMEAENIRKLGFKNLIAVIPNGIDISEFPLKQGNDEKKKKTLLFLSRIHPKKGIDLLIEAWTKLDDELRQNWQVEIAGNGNETYISSLSQQIKKNGLSTEIKIIGPQFGPKKLATYHRADLFILPTYSENFGIVVAEALACGVPVITTKGAPWEELNSNKAGWWIEIGVQPLVECLNNALSKEKQELNPMGLNGRKLIEEKYSIQSVAKKMLELYNWILGNGEKPEFIYE